MRGWAVALFVVLAGLTVYVLFAADPEPPPEVDDTNDPEHTRPDDQPGKAPTRTGLAGKSGKQPAQPDRTKQKQFTVAVRITAHLVERDGSAGNAIDGFEIRITDARGQRVHTERDARNEALVELGVGDYVLTGTLADHIAPGAAKFTITKDSIPITLKLPFRKAEGILELEVIDQLTKSRLEPGAFRLTIETFTAQRARQPEFATRHVPKPDSNPYQVFVRFGETARVRIEADGYEPGKPVEKKLDAQNAKVEEKVFLRQAAQKTGVTFDVVDMNSAPIPRLVVIAERRDPDGKYQPLWRRRTAEPDGKYALPNLGPGDYRLELRSVDADGLPTLHQSHRYEFRFTGNEHIHEPVALKAAGAIELELSDGNGQRIGQGVTVRLTHPDGKVRESVWVPVIDGKMDKDRPRSADHLVVDANARTHPPLPPGHYTVQLTWHNGPAVDRPVLVRAGEKSVVRVTLTK